MQKEGSRKILVNSSCPPAVAKRPHTFCCAIRPVGSPMKTCRAAVLIQPGSGRHSLAEEQRAWSRSCSTSNAGPSCSVRQVALVVPLLPPAGTQWESRRHGALGGRGKSAARKEGGGATSGEVHDLEGLGVDGDCAGKCHNRPVVPVARLVAAFTAAQTRQGRTLAVRRQLQGSKRSHTNSAHFVIAGTQFNNTAWPGISSKSNSVCDPNATCHTTNYSHRPLYRSSRGPKIVRKTHSP